MDQRKTALDRIDRKLYQICLNFSEACYQKKEVSNFTWAKACFFASYLLGVWAISEAMPDLFGNGLKLAATLVFLAKLYHSWRLEERYFKSVERDVLEPAIDFEEIVNSRKFNLYVLTLIPMLVSGTAALWCSPFILLAAALPFALLSSYFEASAPDFFYQRQLDRRMKFGYEPFDF